MILFFSSFLVHFTFFLFLISVVTTGKTLFLFWFSSSFLPKIWDTLWWFCMCLRNWNKYISYVSFPILDYFLLYNWSCLSLIISLFFIYFYNVFIHSIELEFPKYVSLTNITSIPGNLLKLQILRLRSSLTE